MKENTVEKLGGSHRLMCLIFCGNELHTWGFGLVRAKTSSQCEYPDMNQKT